MAGVPGQGKGRKQSKASVEKRAGARRGKTYEQIYGIERATHERNKRSANLGEGSSEGRYYSANYQAWRNAVLLRDDNRCQKCGSTSSDGSVDVHHIIPWNESEGLRFDTANGITLCRNCHNKLEKNNEEMPFYPDAGWITDEEETTPSRSDSSLLPRGPIHSTRDLGAVGGGTPEDDWINLD